MSKFSFKFAVNLYTVCPDYDDDYDNRDQILDNIYLDSDSDDDIIDEIVAFDEDNLMSDTIPSVSHDSGIGQASVHSVEEKETANPKWENNGMFMPKVFNFEPSKSGICKAELKLSEESTILDFFETFVTPVLLEKIAYETNHYWYQYNIQTPTASGVHNWTDTHIKEMYVFLALTMAMARNVVVEDFWDKNSLLYQPIFNEHMSYERYSLLLKMLHFSRNEDQKPGDHLSKVRMPLQEITNNFKNAMNPFENLAIDASFVLWEERLSVRQFYKNEPQFSGLKVFALCDVQTDFIVNIFVYTGSTTEYIETDTKLGISGAVVNTLMKPYLNKGHKLFIGSLYASPSLARFLQENSTNVTGPVRKNSNDMPKFKLKLKTGDTESNHTDTMLVIKTKHPTYNYMLTTQFEDKMVNIRKKDHHGHQRTKPLPIHEYINNMRVIDNYEVLLCPLECVIQNLKWYKKLFFHLIDLSLLNAYCSYKIITGKHIPLAEFHGHLIHQILNKYSSKCASNKSSQPRDCVHAMSGM